MSATAKAEVSGINGATERTAGSGVVRVSSNCHGPITPEGKARSSQNSLKHGLTSRSVVIPGEDPEEWRAFRKSFIESLRPQGRAQLALAETMADTHWLIRRATSIETGLFEHQMKSLGVTLAEAFKDLADNSKSLAVLLRYESQLNRAFDRAFKEFHQLKKLDARDEQVAKPNKPVSIDDLRNEPEPDPQILEIEASLPFVANRNSNPPPLESPNPITETHE